MARDGYYDLSLDDAKRIVSECVGDVNKNRPLDSKQQREIVEIARVLLWHLSTVPNRIEVKDPRSTWWKDRR